MSTLPIDPPLQTWPPIDPAAVTPAIADVALLVASRTRTDDGVERGVFDSSTTPSGDQVMQLISNAVDELLVQLPPTMDPAGYPSVRRLVALRAASFIEISFFRELDGVAKVLIAAYLSDLAALLALLRPVPPRLR